MIGECWLFIRQGRLLDTIRTAVTAADRVEPQLSKASTATVKMSPYLQQAIDSIPADAWTPIPDWEPRDGVAEVAEVRVPAFKDDPIPVRLIVRRVTPKAAKAGEQLALLPDWRYHALVTDIAGPLLEVEAFHRDHADVENTIKDLKYHAGLAHLPSGRFAANAAWLALVVLAYDIGRWALLAGKGIDCFCSTKTLRRRLIACPPASPGQAGGSSCTRPRAGPGLGRSPRCWPGCAPCPRRPEPAIGCPCPTRPHLTASPIARAGAADPKNAKNGLKSVCVT